MLYKMKCIPELSINFYTIQYYVKYMIVYDRSFEFLLEIAEIKQFLYVV